MGGTGIHGYTGPALYGGSYNINNGLITSGSSPEYKRTSGGHAIASRTSPYGSTTVSGSSDYSTNSLQRNMAASVANMAGTLDSDYGDYIREILSNADENTAKSQAFAREQMEFQQKSDAAAMAWSAAEAQKNRDWQERLSNNAHQREVKDLMRAGLNPILSANQGAYTGSGATGQGFSSNGAMGNVDTSGNVGAAQLMGTIMNTASQAAIAKVYTDTQKYQTDMQYAAAKMNAEASIFNNNNSIEANKAINRLNNETAIKQAGIHSSATLGAAGAAAAASRYGADQAYAASVYKTNKDYEAATEHNARNDPFGYFMNALGEVLTTGEYNGVDVPGFKGWNTFGTNNGSINDYNWSLGNGAS